MTQSSRNHLTTLQQALLDIVHKYPSRFSRSGLAKMLVGVKSWQGREYPEYGRFSTHGRKNLTYQIDILLQQGFLALDGRNRLILTSPSQELNTDI